MTARTACRVTAKRAALLAAESEPQPPVTDRERDEAEPRAAAPRASAVTLAHGYSHDPTRARLYLHGAARPMRRT